MSLRVWLPLDGSLENRGISDIEIINNGATIINNGKIGQCYNFNGSSYCYENTYDWSNFNTSAFSLCCWYKEPSPVASGNSQIVCIGTSSGWNNIRIGLLRRTSSGYPMFSVSDGSNSINYNFTATSFSLDTWNHIAVTYNNGTLSMYINGILDKTANTTIIPVLNSSQHLGIGSASNGAEKLTGYLNDVRIYDHCLSQKEVKEISQGLILHYKLDELSTGLNNLAQTGSMSVYNNYSGSGTTGTLTKLNENFNGAPVYRLVMTPNDTSLSNFKTTLGSHGVYGFRQTFKANTKYCFWIYYRPISHLDVRVGGTASNIAGWTEIAPKQVSNKWYRVGQFRNGNIAEDKTDNIFTSFYTPTAVSGQPITIDFASPFLIEGDTNIDEGAYWGLNGINKIPDSSGYGNDGTIIGSLITNEDSLKYQLSSYFNGNLRIEAPFSPPGDNTFSVSGWFKHNSGTTYYASNTTYNTYICLEEGRYFVYPASGSAFVGTYTSTANTWQHIVLVQDGVNSKLKLYINGNLVNQINSTNQLFRSEVLDLGGRQGVSQYKGNISDFRIYATALDAEDVATLYHTSAQVDDLGNIHCFEFEEKQGNSFATELLGIYNSTSANWDNQNNQFIIISRNGISSRSGMVIKNDNSRRLIPWGFTYRFTFDIYVPITTNFNVDYNNYSNDVSVTFSGNDNDNISKRLTSSFTVNANTWTTVTLGSSNTNETKNPNHVTLYDQTSLGIKTDSVDAPVTWYLKNPQWYLVETEKFQVEQNGVFKTNFIKEDDLKDYASFRDNEKAAWANNFIEK